MNSRQLQTQLVTFINDRLAKGQSLERIAEDLEATTYLGFRGVGPHRRLELNIRRLIADRIAADLPMIPTSARHAPAGWLTSYGIAERANCSRRKILRIIEPLRSKHPQLVATFINQAGHPSEHFAPQLVSHIYKEAHVYDPAPEGWLTKWALAKELGQTARTIRLTKESLDDQYPDAVRTYLAVNGEPREHLSPEFVAHIQEALSNRQPAPDGWLNTQSIAKLTDSSHRTIANALKPHAITQPEWVAIYTDAMGKAVDHYHPDLVRLMQKRYQTTPPPTGWRVAHDLAQELGCGVRTVQRVANKNRETHPEWFGSYTARNGKRTEHISPSLIRNIRRALTK